MASPRTSGGQVRTKQAVVTAVLVACAALAWGTVRWLRGFGEPGAVLPNAWIVRGNDQAPLNYAIVHVHAGGATLWLSSKPLSCRDDMLPGDQVQFPPERDAASIDLALPIKGGPVVVDFGEKRGQCDEGLDPSRRPPEPPPTSSLRIEEQTLDRLRGTLTLDEEWWRPGRKGPPCDGSISRHEVGGGTFEASICRTRWQRLRARFGAGP